MSEKSVHYFLIKGKTFGKQEKSAGHCDHYLFMSGRWVRDEDHVIMDHLMEFTPSEPEGSPYRICSTSVMPEMDEISEETAVSLIDRQTMDPLKEE